MFLNICVGQGVQVEMCLLYLYLAFPLNSGLLFAPKATLLHVQSQLVRLTASRDLILGSLHSNLTLSSHCTTQLYNSFAA